MRRMVMIGMVAFSFFLLTSAGFAQGATQPAQPVDPTAQSPAAPAPASDNAGNTGTSPDVNSPSQPGSRVFLGTIVHAKQGYVLKTASMEYKLQDQGRAKEFDGKQVKLMGELNHKKKTIRVESIEASPAM